MNEKLKPELSETEMNNDAASKMNIVFIGHVDHGKSTIVGRLLADTNSLPEGKLDHIRETCQRNSKPFEYAFLIDALKDEQSQGITIDAARVFFKTKKRNYIIFDAPGHIEFLKNMITGAAHAEAALLVIDASEGIQENSRRHGYMASMLGIHQIVVLVNKMDIINYDQTIYNSIVNEYTEFLDKINIVPTSFIPVSGIMGDNITTEINSMEWYTGKSVLEILDKFTSEATIENLPFRMPVQDVYKFTNYEDNRRIIAGTILSGSISENDEIIFYPSGKKSRVKSLEAFNADPGKTAHAPSPTGFTLTEQIYISRGEVAVKSSETKPCLTNRFKASLFWLGNKPMEAGSEYFLKIGSTKIPVYLEAIDKIINASDLQFSSTKKTIERHEVADCLFRTSSAIAFDRSDENTMTSRFVIIDEYEIAGGGIIRNAEENSESWIKKSVQLRNYKWVLSGIPKESRSKKYNQKASIIVITGKKDIGKKPIARALEADLFESGNIAYFLGIGNILYGVDADIKGKETEDEHLEHIRRLSEVAHILLEAGMILIITAIELSQRDLEIIKTIINSYDIEVIWLGKEVTTDIEYSLNIKNPSEKERSLDIIRHYIESKNIINP